MIPVIAIVGRPNVGKSTLFNCLTKSQDALVADLPGVTRDRQYGQTKIGDKPCIVIDTGGIGQQENVLENLTANQTLQAIKESNLVLFVVDARAGLTFVDKEIAQQLRRTRIPIVLVINKMDGVDSNVATAEFYSLGLDMPSPVSTAHGQGIAALLERVWQYFPEIIDPPSIAETVGIKVAIAGRPNVGKSTLINRLLGEERLIVYDAPGTTRDSIAVPIERRGKHYTFIDTAGVRRRSKVTESIEKFSVIKTLRSIEAANVVLFIVDAQTGISEQDMHLLGFIENAGKALVIAVNKWNGLTNDKKKLIRSELDRRLGFVDFAETHFISALHGTGVGDLFKAIDKAYRSATKKFTSSQLTRILEDALAAHQPPLVRGRRIKLRYAHPGGHNPPRIIIHGNQVQKLPDSYRRYLVNTYRHVLRLVGTPIHIVLKSSTNPYAEQVHKKK